jgi:hypothetical protein
MPVFRYFFFVGGALLALLFISDYYLPNSPSANQTADAGEAGIDKSVIRIQSDRKWPERVVFDTSQPTTVPAQIAAAAAPAAVADVSARARVGNAFAQLQPIDQEQAQPSDPKRQEQKPLHKRKIAKRRTAPPVMLVAQQPQFGFFGNNTW